MSISETPKVVENTSSDGNTNVTGKVTIMVSGWVEGFDQAQIKTMFSCYGDVVDAVVEKDRAFFNLQIGNGQCKTTH